VVLVALKFEEGPKFGPCYIQRLRKYTSFCSDCHKICVPYPAWQRMQMDMVGNAGTGGLAKVETHIEAARLIGLVQSNLRVLSESYQFVCCVWGKRCERGEVLIRHDHYVACGVWIRVEAYKAVQTAIDDVSGLLSVFRGHSLSNGVVDGGDHVAKDAMLVVRFGWWPCSESRGNSSA